MPFVPEAGHDDIGTLYLAHREELGHGRIVLAYASLVRGEPATFFTYLHNGGYPVGLVESSMGTRVVCLSGSSLFLCDYSGQQLELIEDHFLGNAHRIDVHGRVAIASGQEMLDGQTRWFALVVDLVARAIVHRMVSPRPLGHPVLLGSHLFALEHFDTNTSATISPESADVLWVTRRELRPGGNTQVVDGLAKDVWEVA